MKLQSTNNKIKHISIRHDAIIDLVIKNPNITRHELCRLSEYSHVHLGTLMNSEAFLERLSERKAELVDTQLFSSIEEKLKAATSQSLELLMEHMNINPEPSVAIKVLEISSKALGFGNASEKVSINNNFVVELPAKSATAAEWVDSIPLNKISVSSDE